MRLIATFFLFFGLFAVDSAAQCTVTTAGAPELVNLRLGMSPSEVNAALAGAASVKVKKDGHYSYFKSFLKIGTAKGVLNGARAFYVRFYDKRVYQIELFYHRDSPATDLENFVRRYSAIANFDFENFEIKNGYATAECEGFTIEADTVLNPHIELTDVAIRKIVEESRKK